jgi:uncharacterized protein (DUF58 family)
MAGRIADVFPPTRRGLLVGAVAGLAVWAEGYGALDLVVFVMGLAALILLVATLIVTTTVAFLIRWRVKPAPTTLRAIPAAIPTTTGYSVPALSLLPFVKVRWSWLSPAGVGVRFPIRDGRIVEEVFAADRGHVPAVVRRWQVGDVFGLTSLHWTRTEPVPVTILPNTGQLREVPLTHSRSGGDVLPHPAGEPEGDRMEIRRYAPGDPVRSILWKQFARTGKLNVRTPERALAQARRTVAYLVASAHDEPAAAAARVALETDALGRNWLFGADGAPEAIDTLEPALRAIAQSASHRETPTGLMRFLETAASEGQVHCIVFAAAVPGPWLAPTVEAARRYAGRVSFVLGTDGVVRHVPRPAWHRFVFAPERQPGTPATALSQVLRTLGTTGAPTLIVDRLTGRAYGEAHQQALRA